MFRLFRIIPILLLIVMLITILRSVIGVVMKTVRESGFSSRKRIELLPERRQAPHHASQRRTAPGSHLRHLRVGLHRISAPGRLSSVSTTARKPAGRNTRSYRGSGGRQLAVASAC